jgi:hypothetical protein
MRTPRGLIVFRVSSRRTDIMHAVGAFADIDQTTLEGSG